MKAQSEEEYLKEEGIAFIKIPSIKLDNQDFNRKGCRLE